MRTVVIWVAEIYCFLSLVISFLDKNSVDMGMPQLIICLYLLLDVPSHDFCLACTAEKRRRAWLWLGGRVLLLGFILLFFYRREIQVDWLWLAAFTLAGLALAAWDAYILVKAANEH